MLIRGAKGPDVTSLQQQVLALGYPLPRWGADGSLGNETLDAVTHLLADHVRGYHDDDRDVVSNDEMGIIARLAAAQQTPVTLPDVFHDLRFTAAQRGVGGRRPWTNITGITLHQVAVDFGREAPERWNTLQAHLGASREGHVFWVHDLEWIVWHANELNGPTVGLECEGNYCGVAGDVSTLWQPEGRKVSVQVPTPELVAAAQQAIRWVCAVVAQHGGRVRDLYAHRQTAGSRRADPGAELWQQVALPLLADAELGLSDGGPEFKIDNGRPIPAAWNPAYSANGY